MTTLINDTVLPIILFIGFYCLYSSWFNCITNRSNTSDKETDIDTIDNFVNEIQELFQELDAQELPESVKSQKLSTIPLLNPTKTRRRNQTQPVKNSVIITPVSVKSLQIPPVPKNPTVKQLKRFIGEHNLQQLVKEKTGKSVSKCKKQELLKALG